MEEEEVDDEGSRKRTQLFNLMLNVNIIPNGEGGGGLKFCFSLENNRQNQNNNASAPSENGRCCASGRR
jgi:hypothetical protein